MIEYLPDIPFNLTQGLSLVWVPAEIGFSGEIVAHQEVFNLVGLLQSSTQPQQQQKRENKQNKNFERAAQCLAGFLTVIERLMLSKGIEMAMR